MSGDVATHAPSFGIATKLRHAPIPVAVPLLLLAALLYWLNPVGYVGGGGDDWQYLSAARCWAANGPCLPDDHWWARWPLVAPMAAAMAVVGESRAALALVPLAYGTAAILLFSRIVELEAGRCAAVVAGATLLLTPVFTLGLGRPNIDLPELCFLLLALAGWLGAARTSRRRYSLLLGAGLALAVLARETSAVFVAAAGIAFLLAPRDRQRVLIWAAPAFALPVAGEMLAYWAATGDPLHRLHLAFAHTRIPSTELASWVDQRESPLFNPDFIAGWRASNGIEAHWTVKPLLNLITHPRIGLSIAAAIALLALVRRSCLEDRECRRAFAILLGVCAAAGIVLVYALGIDPKPRMFLPLAAAASAAIGVASVALWRDRRQPVPLTLAALLVPAALLSIGGAPAMVRAERQAAQWLASDGASITIDETARRYLAMVPAAGAVPIDNPSRPLQLAMLWNGCAPATAAGGHVVRRVAVNAGEWAPAAWLRARFRPPEDGLWLCLLRRPASPAR